jgi:hypothetical protein
MSNEGLIKELQVLLSKHFDAAPGRDPRGAAVPIFLPNKTCPAGLTPCDPNEGPCPSDEFALNPPIYTQDGFRCYTKEGVRKSRLSMGDKNVVVTGVRALVEQLSSMRDVNNELDKLIKNPSSATTTRGDSVSFNQLVEEYKAANPDKFFDKWLVDYPKSDAVLTQRIQEFLGYVSDVFECHESDNRTISACDNTRFPSLRDMVLEQYGTLSLEDEMKEYNRLDVKDRPRDLITFVKSRMDSASPRDLRLVKKLEGGNFKGGYDFDEEFQFDLGGGYDTEDEEFMY